MKHDDLNFAATITREVKLHYRSYLPDDYSESGSGHPLLLFLHGAGERGDDLDLVASTGLPKHIEEGLNLPFVTLCPQCPKETWWDAEALETFLNDAINRYNIDEDRVYLTGLSMGGRGTWELANRVSDRLAAIAPICPPFVWVNPANFLHLPAWCFHGVMDSVVPITDSVKMVRMLRGADCFVKFTTYASADHDSWTRTYTNPELYDWLLSHTRSNHPTQ